MRILRKPSHNYREQVSATEEDNQALEAAPRFALSPIQGAAILAGGRSTRMGTNKALLRIEPGGPTLIELVVARLIEAGIPPTLLVTSPATLMPDEYAFLGLPTAPDDIPGAGALGGILTA